MSLQSLVSALAGVPLGGAGTVLALGTRRFAEMKLRSSFLDFGRLLAGGLKPTPLVAPALAREAWASARQVAT